jgi:hypothetical protein
MIVQYLLAIGCTLLVVSLPIARTPLGGHLRRFDVPSAAQPTFGTTLGCVIGIVLACVLSFAILELRRYLLRPKRDAWSEYISQRSSGKTVLKDREATRERVLPPLPSDADDEAP